MPRSKVTKEVYNKQRRDYYAAHKDQINKRRRELYAEKKNLRKEVSMEIHENGPNEDGSRGEEVCIDASPDPGTTSRMSESLLQNESLAYLTGEATNSSVNEDMMNHSTPSGDIDDQLVIQTTTEMGVNQRLIQLILRSLGKKSYKGDLAHYICAERPPADHRTIVLPKAAPCRHCGAYRYYKETERFCCANGEVALVGSALPYYLIELITGTDTRCKNFQNMIRTYNNHFAFTSIGMKCDETYQHRNHGIYTVKVQGQVHHYLNDLLPHGATNKLQGLQFYFYDSEHEVENRLASLPRLNPSVVVELVDLMKSCNPYSRFLKQASELGNIDSYRLVIRADPWLDQRTYNLPSSTEVAGIWLEDETNAGNHSQLWDIRVYSKSGYSHKVHYYYGCYDPLQYVLMFPKGETGWHGNVPRVGHTLRRRKGLVGRTNIRDFVSFEDIVNSEQEGITRNMFHDIIPDHDTNSPNVSQGRGRATVSCREYYVYKFQVRPNDRSYVLRFGRLFQQFVIDIYIKLETMRLDFLERNQEKMRIDYYQGLIDSVIAGIPVGDKIGKRIYLPASFIGGPRDMKNRYLDSMALVQEYGKPDLFLTMTCNPNWPEIKELLQPGEEAQNRPDLLARVFKSKLGILHDLLMKGDLFGKVSSLVHVVEFQKRGLPHAHLLIILQPAYKYLTPEGYDRIVSAELPDAQVDNYLYGLVVKHMMHGPCGELNPGNVCMQDDKCKNHYPKDFNEYTSHGKGTYPVYRRRDNRRKAKVRGKVLDNRWVIPYNPTLLMLFNCHINVEICCDIRAVKYLYKYVHKGHDKVMFRISPDSQRPGDNEIEDFQKGRWVSPVEAAWRIYGFPLNDMYPPVLQLQVHTPNFQTIAFEDDADLERLLQDARLQRSMLTEFFRMNHEDPEAKKLNLLYKEYPKYYVWDVQARRWSRRKKRQVIGRLAVVNPMENERYYLRVLLSNVRGPTSYEDLLTVHGTTFESFQEASLKRGLLHNDDDVDKTMQEASIYKMPSELRRLFATLLHYCRPSNAKKLFETYFEHMAEDYRRLQHLTNLTYYEVQCKVLQGISDTLESLGRNINDYRLVPFKYTPSDFERYTRDIAAEKSIPVPDADLHSLHLLNLEQKEAFNVIFKKAVSNEGGIFFLDGPGGTGKSFVYKVLSAHIRSAGYVALIVASSGIAASCFLGGRTAHSRFKIPIDAEVGVRCQIAKQSSDADLIRASRILIWDEAPMAHQAVIHALDFLLKDICESDEPFGGKLVVFGGDFRQVLPVVKGGSRRQQIDASIISSDLWEYFTKLQLTENMRARFDPGFVEYLMRIGNGEEPTNTRGQVEIPSPMLIPYTDLEQSIELLISTVYPDLTLFEKTPFDMMTRVILCPKNEHVDDINSRLIQRISGQKMIYTSDDRAKNLTDQGDYIDYLNTLEPKGLPQHKLLLKVNCPVILLRNINPVEGLCNGTRLICKQLLPNVVGAVIAGGQFMGKHVWIPRIPLEPNPADNKYSIPFVRRQVPLRLCFAMTINKSQGQTLDYVGIYLRQPVFTHGQLYVALSRAKTGKNVKVLLIPPTWNDPATKYTSNIVFSEILEKARPA